MDSKWEVLEQSNEAREKIWGRNRSFAGDVWFRFHRKPTAIAGFVIIMLLMLFAFLGPLFTGRSYSEQNRLSLHHTESEAAFRQQRRQLGRTARQAT